MASRKTTRFRRERGSEGDAPPPARQPVQSGAAPPREPPAEDRPTLDTTDLMALADMDPAELAAAMEGQLDTKPLEIGEKATGLVTRVGREDVFIDLGGKAEGVLPRGELPEASVGDEVEAFVLSAGDYGVRLTTKLTGAAAAGLLDEACESGVPVEGRVTSRNPGGFEVRIGSTRAFCPASMISRLPDVDLDAYVGQTLAFRVIEAGDKVVVNRRVIQEEEIAEKAEELWGELAEGGAYRGTVRAVKPFGAFVDIGGVDGLVPRSEISWSPGSDPAEVMHVGQVVEVHVLAVDRATRKLTLSARSAESDPWTRVGTEIAAGGVYTGVVKNVQPFGAFVELGPGLQGLLHVSRAPSGLPEVGTELRVRVLQIDEERRRLALAPVTAGEAGDEAVSSTAKGTVRQVLSNGVVVQLDDGRTGWLAAQEVELPPGTVLAQRFRRGKALTARVVSEDGERVVLSLREDAAAARAGWQQHVGGKQTGGAGFGTLGDLLGGLKLPKS